MARLTVNGNEDEINLLGWYITWHGNTDKFVKILETPQTYRNCVFDKTLCNKAISDLWQVGGFLLVLWVPSPIKLKYCWKWR